MENIWNILLNPIKMDDLSWKFLLKWMVKITENPIKIGWFGGSTLFWETPKWTRIVSMYFLSKNWGIFQPSLCDRLPESVTLVYLDVPLEVSKWLGSVGYIPNIPHL